MLAWACGRIIADRTASFASQSSEICLTQWDMRPPVVHRKIRCLPELLASYRTKFTDLFAFLSPGNVDGCSVAWGLSVTLKIPADIRISEGVQ